MSKKINSLANLAESRYILEELRSERNNFLRATQDNSMTRKGGWEDQPLKLPDTISVKFNRAINLMGKRTLIIRSEGSLNQHLKIKHP